MLEEIKNGDFCVERTCKHFLEGEMKPAKMVSYDHSSANMAQSSRRHNILYFDCRMWDFTPVGLGLINDVSIFWNPINRQ